MRNAVVAVLGIGALAGAIVYVIRDAKSGLAVMESGNKPTAAEKEAEFQKKFSAAMEHSTPESEPPKEPESDTRPGRKRDWPADRNPGHVVPVTPRELVNAYHANELKADGLYLGQVLSLTGRVYRVERMLGDVIVHVGEPLRSVSVYVSEREASKAAQLSRGDIITIEGWGAGAMALGTPKMTSALFASVKKGRSDDDE